MKKQITLPYGEIVELRDMFRNPDNADTINDPVIIEDFGRNSMIDMIYNEIRSYWCKYENKHGRHIYDFDKCVLSQMNL